MTVHANIENISVLFLPLRSQKTNKEQTWDLIPESALDWEVLVCAGDKP